MKYTAIARTEGKEKTPILFFPEAEANLGMIVCATREGHTEASLGYYRKTKQASFDTSFLCLGYKEEELVLRKKINYDTLRKGWYKK